MPTGCIASVAVSDRSAPFSLIGLPSIFTSSPSILSSMSASIIAEMTSPLCPFPFEIARILTLR